MTIREYIAEEVAREIVEDLRDRAYFYRTSYNAGQMTWGQLLAVELDVIVQEIEVKYAPGKPQLVK